MLLLSLWPWSGSSVSPVSRFLQWGAMRIPWHTLTKPRAWHIGTFNISTFLFPSLFLSLFYIVFCETRLNSRSSKVTSEVMLSCLFKNKNHSIEEIFLEIRKIIYRLKWHKMFQEKLMIVRELMKLSLSYWTLWLINMRGNVVYMYLCNFHIVWIMWTSIVLTSTGIKYNFFPSVEG